MTQKKKSKRDARKPRLELELNPADHRKLKRAAKLENLPLATWARVELLSSAARLVDIIRAPRSGGAS